MIRKFLLKCLVCVSFALVLLSSNAYAAERLVNQVVAVVNNDVITQAEIDKQLALLKYRVKSMGKEKELPSDAVLRQQILQQLIDRDLQLQLAERANVTVGSDEINQAISRIAQQNQVSTRELYDRMAKTGFSVKDFRNEVKQEILLQIVQGQEVASRISISQEQIDDVLKRMQQQKVQYHVGDILVALPATPSPEQVDQAQQKAANIVKQLQSGANFDKLAMADSNAQNALKGGDMGWRTLAEMPNLFASHVLSMNPGEVAGPLRAANGFHVIKLFAVRNTQLPKGAAAQREEVKNLLFQQQFQQSLLTWLQQLRAESYIKIYR